MTELKRMQQHLPLTNINVEVDTRLVKQSLTHEIKTF